MLPPKERRSFVDSLREDQDVPSREIRYSFGIPALADEYVGSVAGQSTYERLIGVRLDSPELLGSAKPGFLTWLGDVVSGKQTRVDYSDYYLDLDPISRRLNRQHGIYYRDPAYWP